MSTDEREFYKMILEADKVFDVNFKTIAKDLWEFYKKLENKLKEEEHDSLVQTVKLCEAEEKMYNARTYILKQTEGHDEEPIEGSWLYDLLEVFKMIGGQIDKDNK